MITDLNERALAPIAALPALPLNRLGDAMYEVQAGDVPAAARNHPVDYPVHCHRARLAPFIARITAHAMDGLWPQCFQNPTQRFPR